MRKGKKYLAGREEGDPRGLSMSEQESAVLESGGELEEESTFQEEVVEEAEKQGLETHDVKSELDAQEKQGTLLPGNSPIKQPTVKGDKILAEYVRPHFFIEEDVRFCGLEFSFSLDKDHKGKLPKPIESAWHFVEKRGFKGVIGIEVSNQLIDIYLASDIKEPEIQLGTVEISKANVSIVKAIGKGAAERTIRFSFQVVCEIDKELRDFAVAHFGNSVWIEMKQIQGELPI